MPFIPHTEDDIHSMLQTLGMNHIDQLFAEIPASLQQFDGKSLPKAIGECELTKHMKQRAAANKPLLNFIGAGAYQHHIPAAVFDLISRGELLTAYTPYQAEASQGTLQIIYEYQSMMANLLNMDVSNASLYDGASALAEAILMAVRIKKDQAQRIIVPQNLNPRYRQCVQTLTCASGIELIELAFDENSGQSTLEALAKINTDNVAALVMTQPNFFGICEPVAELSQWAKQQGLLTIAVVNPLAAALLKPPGDYGIDIACGEGQALGVPLAYGGPYYGFLCCAQQHIRQLPGRIVGKTEDSEGQSGYVLTLQTREQHIRRAKATSNICTNQGLMVTASTLYMSLLGPEGLRRTALQCHHNCRQLAHHLSTIKGVKRVFNGQYFHELLVQFEQPVAPLLARLQEAGIDGGYPLACDYPMLNNSLLICTTEMHQEEELLLFADQLNRLTS